MAVGGQLLQKGPSPRAPILTTVVTTPPVPPGIDRSLDGVTRGADFPDESTSIAPRIKHTRGLRIRRSAVRISQGSRGGAPPSRGDSLRARELAEEAIRSAVRVEGPVTEVPAQLAALRSDAPAAERSLREAHRLFTEMGATGHAARLAKELGSS